MHFSLFGVRGLIKRALISVPGGCNEFKASIPQTDKQVIIRLGTTDVAAFEHVFINDEYDFSLVRPPSIIVDAGANVGMSAVYFALRYPGATIIAVEPEPSNFAILLKNAELFPQIIPINAALWKHEGLVHIQDGGGGHWGMRTIEGKVPTRQAIRATTIQALMQHLRIEQIDLLKIDVEGAECEIFEEPSPWIGHVGVICTELHDRFRPGCLEIYRAATVAFPIRWRQGELDCAAREGLILALSPSWHRAPTTDVPGTFRYQESR
jgi:FkbM family methyltransferase